jgi:hypothetical protein
MKVQETSMSERHWEEQQRSVLGRLFDSIFGRREASEDKIDKSVGCCNSQAGKISRIMSPPRRIKAKGSNRPLEPHVEPSSDLEAT